jgi:uncharacterized RDD family membrane protein YckC
MRCPKCHYLSFEPEPRCKNCGYDLALGPDDPVSKVLDRGTQALADFDLRGSDDVPVPRSVERPLNRISLLPRVEPTDLVMRWPESSGAAAAPSVEVPVRAAAPAAVIAEPLPVAPPPVRVTAEPVRGASGPARVAPEPVRVAPEPARIAARRSTSDLPLFLREMPDRERPSDEPLVKVPSSPRAPLSVRRNTPPPGRVKEAYERPQTVLPRQARLIERDPVEPAVVPEPAPAPPPAAAPVIVSRDESRPAAPTPKPPPTPIPAVPVRAIQRASTPRRVEAAIIDALFIGAINVALILLTLQRCNLTIVEIGTLPMWPVLGMLLLIDGGYLLMFTATTGQTVGKMAAGIRVVDADPRIPGRDRVTVGQAALRSLLTFPSLFALGAGFFPALFGDHRAVHDRLTHTRVVRV